MSLLKAIFLGALLTWVVSLILGKNHQSGGWLGVHEITIQGYSVDWSWPLFIAATGLAWAIIAMLD